jgi:hypothetical protein
MGDLAQKNLPRMLPRQILGGGAFLVFRSVLCGAAGKLAFLR